MNTKLRKEANNEFKKDFFKLMNNSVFGKAVEKVRNHRDIRLVTSNKRRKRLVSEPNYHSHKKFSEYLIAIEMKKTNVEMNKPIYLGMPILDISKILMYEFWYEYLCMNFGMTALNQDMETEQNYAIWILIALFLILQLKNLMKILPMILKDGLIHLTLMKMIKGLF